MERPSLALYAVLIVLLLIAGNAPVSGAREAIGSSLPTPFEDDDSRKPFALDLPELNLSNITETDTIIPRYDLQTMRLRIKNPYAELINYGKIHLKINGESAETAAEKGASSEGKIITLNVGSKPQFHLYNGKNVIEIIASDTTGKPYYASYVLRTGRVAKPSGETHNAEGRVEYFPVKTGSDQEPPIINLKEPQGAVEIGRVQVSGTVTDNSKAIASVTINGTAVVNISPSRNIKINPTGKIVGASLAFAALVTMSPEATALVVEARDRAGNMTRLSLPVRQRGGAVAARFTGQKYAVIIGISDHKYNQDGLTDLRFCDADARSFRDCLLQERGGGFSASNILYIENAEATLDGVRAALYKFLAKARRNDLMIIYLSGHGSPDPFLRQNLYFIMYDTKVTSMESTAMPMSELQNLLDNRLQAERAVIFIDTCHSAGVGGKQMIGRGLKIENNLLNLYATKLFRETGRAILTAADVDELAFEDQKWGGGHGIFTFALLAGLEGNADRNHDKLITTGELFAYVRARVSRETDFQQNPIALPGSTENLTLAYVSNR